MAVAGDAVIHTLKGDRRVDKLAATGERFYCFTWNGSKIGIGKARVNPAARRSEVMRLVLDDGTSMRVTADKKAIHRTAAVGSPFENQLSLMPLYLGKTTHGYPTYKQMHTGYTSALAPCDQRRVRLVARMVYEIKTGKPIETGMIVRHIDNDKKNCEPENLRVEGKHGPKRRHKKTGWLLAAQRFKPPTNHKVAGFEPFGEDDVFDIIDADCDNLAVGGIFLVIHGTA